MHLVESLHDFLHASRPPVTFLESMNVSPSFTLHTAFIPSMHDIFMVSAVAENFVFLQQVLK
jgi:hypothetical protein